VEVVPYRGRIARKLAVAAGGPAPAAMLVLRDPLKLRDTRIARLRERYGLTQAEATLAVEMLAGDGRAAAAGRCGISINTARTHLMRVFEKTGVSRQAELIRLLLD
jgi:DNA-binding CsgD family transcriptional regulator